MGNALRKLGHLLWGAGDGRAVRYDDEVSPEVVKKLKSITEEEMKGLDDLKTISGPGWQIHVSTSKDGAYHVRCSVVPLS